MGMMLVNVVAMPGMIWHERNCNAPLPQPGSCRQICAAELVARRRAGGLSRLLTKTAVVISTRRMHPASVVETAKRVRSRLILKTRAKLQLVMRVGSRALLQACTYRNLERDKMVVSNAFQEKVQGRGYG